MLLELLMLKVHISHAMVRITTIHLDPRFQWQLKVILLPVLSIPKADYFRSTSSPSISSCKMCPDRGNDAWPDWREGGAPVGAALSGPRAHQSTQ